MENRAKLRDFEKEDHPLRLITLQVGWSSAASPTRRFTPESDLLVGDMSLTLNADNLYRKSTGDNTSSQPVVRISRLLLPKQALKIYLCLCLE